MANKKDPKCIDCGVDTTPFPSSKCFPLRCEECDRKSLSERAKHRCASRDYDKSRKHFTRTCSGCGKEFSVKGLQDSHRRKNCSRECYLTSLSRRIDGSHLQTEEVFEARSLATVGKPKEHPATRKGNMGNVTRYFHVTSPDGVDYAGKNVTHFVRQNPELFSPEDAAFKSVNACRRPRRAKVRCRAVAGLLTVIRGSRGSWKGWTATTPIHEDKRRPTDVH